MANLKAIKVHIHSMMDIITITLSFIPSSHRAVINFHFQTSQQQVVINFNLSQTLRQDLVTIVVTRAMMGATVLFQALT